MIRSVLCIAPLAALLAAPVLADEGMWTFDNPPTRLLQEKYHFTPTQQWLDHVRLSCVRLNDGGSGSFVSPNGLLLTNHHVARGQLQKNSTKDRDYVKDGFYAATPEREMKSPDLEVNVLVSLENVTARVNEAVGKGKPPAEEFAARKAAIAGIESESQRKTGLRSDVVTANTGSTGIRSTPTCAWFSLPNSRPPFSAAIRITSLTRATTSTWRSSASMTTASRSRPRTI